MKFVGMLHKNAEYEDPTRMTQAVMESQSFVEERYLACLGKVIFSGGRVTFDIPPQDPVSFTFEGQNHSA